MANFKTTITKEGYRGHKTCITVKYRLYCITNLVNEKCYIGITQEQIQDRFNNHISRSRKPKYPLQHAIAKYGRENFKIESICESEDRSFIANLEQIAIEIKKSHITENGYNVALGGFGGNLGKEATKNRLETIANYPDERRRAWKLKLHLRNLGKTKANDLGRASQAEKMLGNSNRKEIPHSIESKAKISLGNIGKIRSEEAKLNYSNAAKLRGTGPQLQGKKVSCLCCKKEWDLGNYTKHARKLDVI